MERPTRDEVLMDHARLVATRSTCSRLNVGAVGARQGRLLVSGYNGAPSGTAHCSHECTCRTGGDYKEGHEWGCATISPCQRSVHAEANVIAFAARWGISLEGAELFTTHSPCLTCAQLIVNSGIIRVVYGELFRTVEGLKLLEEAGIKCIMFGCPSKQDLI